MFIICTDYRKLPALKIHELSGFRENRVHLGSCDRASWNVRWREINQQDATNPMFIIEFLCQHVSQQHYAHPQEKKTVYYYIWCSALVVLAVVVCSWVVSCVHCVKVTVSNSNRTAVPSWSCSQAVWHTPLLCVRSKTLDDGQRNCPKHVELYSKNKFEKLVHLAGFIIRNDHDKRSSESQINYTNIITCFSTPRWYI